MNRAYDAVSPIFSAPFWRLHRDEALSVGHRHWVEYRMAFEPDRRAEFTGVLAAEIAMGTGTADALRAANQAAVVLVSTPRDTVQ